jgi:hypothetical protein
MGVDIEGVLPTTNHLESFNGVLKRKHIANWQRSGHRLRYDILINRLIISILPNIYGQHRMLNAYQSWKVERFRDAAGGNSLTKHSPIKSKPNSLSHPLAWFTPNSQRDSMAQDIVRLN